MRLLERSRAIAVPLTIVIAPSVVPGVGWADDDKKDRQETRLRPGRSPAWSREPAYVGDTHRRDLNGPHRRSC